MDNCFSDTQLLGQCQTHLVELNDGRLIHSMIKRDWLTLLAAAANDGIDIAIASSYRSFEQQLSIWNNKAQGKRVLNDRNNQPLDYATLSQEQLLTSILNWSALPGASRHHWGCDLDIYCPSMVTRQALKLEPWEYQPDGPMAALTHWLDNNLAQHGFFRPYNKDRGGVAIEPWHISHQGVASHAMQQLTPQLLHQALVQCEISLKPQIIAKLDTIYQQYVMNVEQL